MQLTAEINGLRLLLAGSLSDYFVKHRPQQESDEPELTKLKTTLGFQVTVTPDRRYKDAVAIVEVEVQGLQQLSPELPAVTALIPREKTYNVAAITDKSTSIGGGVATQILGFSGSWVRGHKTYYLVQDQDTVALTYRPTNNQKTGFRWQFRPVLGQRYVKTGLKQTFVQLAFPTLEGALDNEIGRVTVRTYWRKYDRKVGILKEVVPGSYREMYRDSNIPSFKQPVTPIAFNPVAGLEDLGGGQMLVKLDGRFLPGTYVRIGSLKLTEGAGLQHEYHGIKFTAPIATLATRNVFLVAHDGTEEQLKFTVRNCSPGKEPEISEATATAVDDTTSWLRVRVKPAAIGATMTLPRPVFVIGQRVFGHADAPIKVEEQNAGTPNHMVFLSAIVPNVVYTPTAELVVKPLFAPPGCTSNGLPIGALKPPGPERLTPLEQNTTELKFLLTGTGLSTVQVLSPADARLERIGPSSEADKLLLLILKPEHLKSNKQVLLQRGSTRPFLVTIPEFEPKPPAPLRALGRIDIKADVILIVGDGMNGVESVTFNEQKVTFKALDDKNLLLSNLRALSGISSAGTKRFFVKFKSEAKPKEVDVEVANEIVNTNQ
jgi:hypothetical protein